MRKSDSTSARYILSNIRNFCIISHVDHGKTTLSDHLLVSGKMLPETMAGKLRALDNLEIEQDRGITIEDSLASFEISKNNEKYLVNLIDTPGHVDFSGRVSDALVLVDNGLIIVDAVEGVMAQTITVIRQAIKLKLHLILFINKIDRLISELELSVDQIRSRIENIIGEIHSICLEYNYHDILPTFGNGKVIVGSALDGWGVTKNNSSLIDGFNGVISWYKMNNKFPSSVKLSQIMNDVIINQLKPPSYLDTADYFLRWKISDGIETFNHELREDTEKLKTILLAGKIFRHGKNMVNLVRIVSGNIKTGQKVFANSAQEEITIKKIQKYRGKRKIELENAYTGDIVGVIFSKTIDKGEIITDKNQHIERYSLEYLHEPVMEITVEPQNYDQYDELVGELEILERLHSNVRFKQSKETGELLIAALGPLQLEIIINELKQSKFEVYTSNPQILEYMIPAKKCQFEMENGDITVMVSPKNYSMKDTLSIIFEDGNNNTLSIHPEKTNIDQGGLVDAFTEWTEFGFPVEKVRDIYLEVRDTGLEAPLSYEETLIMANKLFREISIREILDKHIPMFKILISIDEEFIGGVVQVINKYRGNIHEIKKESSKSKIEAIVPIDTQDLVNDLRRVTDGRIFWNIIETIYQKK